MEEYNKLHLSGYNWDSIYILLLDVSDIDTVISIFSCCTWNALTTHDVINSTIMSHVEAIILPMQNFPLHIDGLSIYLKSSNTICNLSLPGIKSIFNNGELLHSKHVAAPFGSKSFIHFAECVENQLQLENYWLLSLSSLYWYEQLLPSNPYKNDVMRALDESCIVKSFIYVDSTYFDLYKIKSKDVLHILLEASLQSPYLTMIVVPDNLEYKYLYSIMKEYGKIDFWQLHTLLNYTRWILINNFVSLDTPVICFLSCEYSKKIHIKLLSDQIKGAWIG
ncbi:MAG: hypothetical protein LBH59_08475 [Planctomycetaceae bacterium]|nr:hypothetical protein [Planctomycetaceae bacterium]